MDQLEKQTQRADDRMTRVEASLSQIQTTLAGLSTKDTVRNLGLALGATIIATVLTAAGLLLASSSNQLAAFQSGLAAIQTFSSTKDIASSVPLVPPKVSDESGQHVGSAQSLGAPSPKISVPSQK